MDETYISIQPGDELVITHDTDGYPAVKIRNKALMRMLGGCCSTPRI
ncbi:hypothetical protein [Paenarthrobacter nicotinovorans]|nr:hypothetical protein [Paenarthrobacter nicotinovorans]